MSEKVKNGHAAMQGSVNDLSDAPIRSQLLWASLFPLIVFALLTTLVITTLLHKLTLDLVIQRNSAQTQLLAAELTNRVLHGKNPDGDELLTGAWNAGASGDISVVLLDTQEGTVISSTGNSFALYPSEMAQISQGTAISGQLMQSMDGNEQIVVSSAPITGSPLCVILIESWSSIIMPTINYQFLLAMLSVVGIVCSLTTLSMAIGRIIQPLQVMATNATEAIPGSIFHPMPESGPVEIRALTNAFNKMVIRLAKQQASIRQYAQKAMLSQEEERQRLSHELHDGTLQDLVALSQRVELCQTEINHDPEIAHHRLDEIQSLLNTTIENVRRISIALRPPALEDFGLISAVTMLCKEMNQSHPQIKCELHVLGQPLRLPPDKELAIFRVVQEALTNIRKHAPDAHTVQVEIIFSETEVTARVSNDGGPFDQQDIHSQVQSGHLGLAGMNERAKLFGGTFKITSTKDNRTRLVFQIPIMQDEWSGHTE